MLHNAHFRLQTLRAHHGSYTFIMRFALLFLLACAASAENRKDASALIQKASDAVNSVKSWRIEGTISDSRYTSPATFTLLMRPPVEVRFQVLGGPTPAIIVCDKANAWIYSPPLNRYRTEPISGSTLCSPIVGEWKSLPTTLKSPVFAGRRAVKSGGQTIDCDLVRGKSNAPPPSSGEITRELCIDPATDLILTEKEELHDEIRTYSYNKIERDPDMAPNVFLLSLLPGSQRTQYDLPVPERLGASYMNRDPLITKPRLLSRQSPVYDDISRRKRVEGAVILYVVIDASGLPSQIDVYKQLNPALDLSAIEAVRHWRFAPATKDKKPVAIAAMIEVNFRL
jgi:TonB family protein